MARKPVPLSAVHQIRRAPHGKVGGTAARWGFSRQTASRIVQAKGRYRDIVTPGWSCDWPREQDSVMAHVDGDLNQAAHWYWTGGLQGGTFPLWRPQGNKTSFSARKAVYILHRGPFDESLYRVVRNCPEPTCVNPWHAFLDLHYREPEEYTLKGSEETERSH